MIGSYGSSFLFLSTVDVDVVIESLFDIRRHHFLFGFFVEKMEGAARLDF
jgi:hypothetical protein